MAKVGALEHLVRGRQNVERRQRGIGDLGRNRDNENHRLQHVPTKEELEGLVSRHRVTSATFDLPLVGSPSDPPSKLITEQGKGLPLTGTF